MISQWASIPLYRLVSHLQNFVHDVGCHERDNRPIYFLHGFMRRTGCHLVAPRHTIGTASRVLYAWHPATWCYSSAPVGSSAGGCQMAPGRWGSIWHLLGGCLLDNGLAPQKVPIGTIFFNSVKFSVITVVLVLLFNWHYVLGWSVLSAYM